jgi:hypothetical protein
VFFDVLEAVLDPFAHRCTFGPQAGGELRIRTEVPIPKKQIRFFLISIGEGRVAQDPLQGAYSDFNLFGPEKSFSPLHASGCIMLFTEISKIGR